MKILKVIYRILKWISRIMLFLVLVPGAIASGVTFPPKSGPGIMLDSMI